MKTPRNLLPSLPILGHFSRSRAFIGQISVRLALAFLILTYANAHANAASGRSTSTWDLTKERFQISVITYGPGHHPFTKFGHNAIWVSDKITGEDSYYNFGTFDFGNKNLISDFMEGRLQYWLSVTGEAAALNPYRRTGRSAVVQELDLNTEAKLTLVNQLRVTLLPENRYYIYDYYADNCSTRVRDIIDKVTHGELRRVSNSPAKWTWREHTLRLSQDALIVSLGLDFALGPPVDAKNTLWEEMFLPGVLAETLRLVRVGDASNRRPLVQREYALLESTHPPEPNAPPLRWPWMAVVGLLIASLFHLPRLNADLKKGSVKSATALLWWLTASWGLIAGLLGSLLTFFWAGTNHEIAYYNQNLFFFSPIALLLPLLALRSGSYRRAQETAYRVILTCSALALLGFMIQLLPQGTQETRRTAALAVPAWAGLAWAWRRRFAAWPKRLEL